MKKTFGLLGLLFVMMVCAFSAQAYDYEIYGKIGKYPVYMEFDINSGRGQNVTVNGRYCYTQSGSGNYLYFKGTGRITGHLGGPTSVRGLQYKLNFKEKNNKGQVTGTFNGTFVDGMGGDSLEGTFINFKGKRFTLRCSRSGAW